MQLYSLNSGGRVSAKAGALIDRKSAAKRCFDIPRETRLNGKEITAAALGKRLRH